MMDDTELNVLHVDTDRYRVVECTSVDHNDTDPISLMTIPSCIPLTFRNYTNILLLYSIPSVREWFNIHSKVLVLSLVSYKSINTKVLGKQKVLCIQKYYQNAKQPHTCTTNRTVTYM